MGKITFSVSVDNLAELDELVNRIQVQLNQLNNLLSELYEFKIQVVLKPNP
ncbi:hypothetical protein [Snodgrassella communis]|uniref:hypothetical protein n=1 Tax=Snodgrassella communis TaxID=2946699 RepID=UPI0015D56925|nr:hypothetical protein [Snodgrassella communis]